MCIVPAFMKFKIGDENFCLFPRSVGSPLQKETFSLFAASLVDWAQRWHSKVEDKIERLWNQTDVDSKLAFATSQLSILNELLKPWSQSISSKKKLNYPGLNPSLLYISCDKIAEWLTEKALELTHWVWIQNFTNSCINSRKLCNFSGSSFHHL